MFCVAAKMHLLQTVLDWNQTDPKMMIRDLLDAALSIRLPDDLLQVIGDTRIDLISPSSLQLFCMQLYIPHQIGAGIRVAASTGRCDGIPRWVSCKYSSWRILTRACMQSRMVEPYLVLGESKAHYNNESFTGYSYINQLYRIL